jgi:hypothetical protein
VHDADDAGGAPPQQDRFGPTGVQADLMRFQRPVAELRRRGPVGSRIGVCAERREDHAERQQDSRQKAARHKLGPQ